MRLSNSFPDASAAQFLFGYLFFLSTFPTLNFYYFLNNFFLINDFFNLNKKFIDILPRIEIQRTNQTISTRLAKNTKKKSKSKQSQQEPFPALEMAPSDKSNQLVLKEKNADKTGA